MIIKQPPLYPETQVIPSFTDDPDHNSAELAACSAKASELDCKVWIPEGTWPMRSIYLSSHEKNWKVMSVTRGGTVSLIKDLTKAEAEFMRCRLLGLPATPEEAASERERWEQAHPPGPNYENNGQNVSEKQWAEWRKQHPYAQGCRYPNGGSSWGGGRLVQDSDMKTVEIFQ